MLRWKESRARRGCVVRPWVGWLSDGRKPLARLTLHNTDYLSGFYTISGAESSACTTGALLGKSGRACVLIAYLNTEGRHDRFPPVLIISRRRFFDSFSRFPFCFFLT